MLLTIADNLSTVYFSTQSHLRVIRFARMTADSARYARAERGPVRSRAEGCWTSDHHYCWRAIFGSRRDACQAGMKLAVKTTTIIKPDTSRYVQVSHAVTPCSMLPSARVDTAESIRPRARPTSASQSPCLSTNARRSEAVAPTARRMANSRRRCAVRYETTPYKPTLASTRARAAKTPISTELIHWPRNVRS